MTGSSIKHDDRIVLEQLLAPHGQQHLLRYWPELGVDARNHLKAQIESIDWDELDSLLLDKSQDEAWSTLAARAEGPPAVTLSEFRNAQRFESAYAVGANALRNQEVAFILTAGGQGSRLGFEHPKGMYPLGPLSGRSLFQILIEASLARARQFKCSLPLYIMTSPQTHAETREFLEKHEWFGYPVRDIHLFCQGSMPAVDRNSGRVLLSEKGILSTNPDGHGGMLKALVRSGFLDDMRSRGIQSIFYGQIDNPLLQVCNPALIGFHLQAGSEMTTQVIRKREALQKVGNVVQIDGQVRIIEYSDLPAQFARQQNADHSLKFWAGSIAVHVFSRRFLEQAYLQGNSLPFHRAFKKVPCLNEQGQLIVPSENNAIKFERFVFDLLPMAKNALVCEVEAEEGFAALKNAPGEASETPAWVRAAMVNLHKKWIRNAGGIVSEGVEVEISPLVAVDERQFRDVFPDPLQIQSPTYLATGNSSSLRKQVACYAAIMAGGSGTRFWPASRNSFPKQFLKMGGNATLLQETVARLKGLCNSNEITVITNRRLVPEVLRQLPELSDSSVIGEPCKRDTAPCIGLAAAFIAAKVPDAIMVVMPADHLIQPVGQFQDAIRFACELVQDDPGRLVTFGIQPTFPSEAYGYIEKDSRRLPPGRMPAFPVRQFKEKPDFETAKRYLESGDFLWNSGIFVWKASTIITAIRKFEGEMAERIDNIVQARGSLKFDKIFDEQFHLLKGKSIDYAVMERYSNVVVVEAPFMWDDVGNWNAMERLHRPDGQGNAVSGQYLGVNSDRNIVFGSSDHLIATVGVQDLIIVHTADATLVAQKSDEKAIKKLVELIEKNGLQQYL